MANQGQQQPQPQQPNIPLRASDFFPPKISGDKQESPQAHWLAYEDYVALQGLNNQLQLARLQTTLSGSARQWIEGRAVENVNDMKRRFLEKFAGMHTRDGTVKMFRSIKYKQGESM